MRLLLSALKQMANPTLSFRPWRAHGIHETVNALRKTLLSLTIQ